MSERASAAELPEPELNELLRRVDWRFLLGQEEAPLIADLTAGRDSRAVRLIGRGEPPPGAADVAVIGYPTKLALGAARDAVRLGGAVVCLWRAPRLGGSGRAVARLRRAGLSDPRVLWPGPRPRRSPQFWLPLGSDSAASHLLSTRPARSAAQSLVRAIWKAAARAGLLAPLCAIARLPPDGTEADPPTELDAILPPDSAPLLLTGGGRSINKVVALPFSGAAGEPPAVVKFARVAAADAALDHEAAALRAVEDEHAGVLGVPRVLASGRRGGRRALAESAIYGRPLIGELSATNFAELGARVGEWLTGLVGAERPEAEEWRQRLVGEPLAVFERQFGAVIDAAALSEIRARLDRLGSLPAACEHRDCSPWNVVLGRGGAPALLDWESAEPRGLPGLDLAYFLANAAFVLDGALESGRTRESYVDVLDPATPHGRVAAQCAAAYCDQAGIDAEDYARLRLLAWIVHAHSDFRHLEMAAAGPPSPEALRGATHLGLIEIELSGGG